MTPPRSILAALFGIRLVRDARLRRTVLAVLAVIFAILCVWPRAYLARTQLIPNDSAGGLSSFLGAASASSTGGLLGTLFGGRQSIEVDLVVARSEAVLNDVVSRLRKAHYLKASEVEKMTIRLRKQANIEAVRGGILQISVLDRDRQFGLAVVQAYIGAIRDRLASMNLAQTSERKAIAENRMRDATLMLARTQDILNRYRTANKLATSRSATRAGNFAGDRPAGQPPG